MYSNMHCRQDWINQVEGNRAVILARSEGLPTAITAIKMRYHRVCEPNDAASCSPDSDAGPDTLDIATVALATVSRSVM